MRPSLVLAALLVAAPARSQQPAFHVLHYDLSLTLPDSGKRIEGVAKLTVRRRRTADTLALDLEDLKVERVLAAGAPAPFAQDTRHLRIPTGTARGDTLEIEIAYGGVPTDGLIIGTDSAGRWIAFGDNWPNRARHWIPSIDHPSDKATVSWSVNAPSDRRVVANGQLLEETPLPASRDPAGNVVSRGARTLTRWRESRPIPVYLMTIAAAPLARFDLGATACGLAEAGGCVPQQVYVAPEQLRILPGEFARAGDIVAFYSRTVAPFPYEKLAHLQSSTRYGGMENASAIFYADRLFRTRGAPAALIAHETAHQWFGDAVTEREWGHVWLSEGFATYFASLWSRHAFGDSTFASEMAQTRAQILRDQAVATRPVIDTLQTDLMSLLNTNSYQKGGWTLHMLRTLVGDSAFFQGVRDYFVAHKHGTALTDDLMTAVEHRAGVPLGWFFDQWLRRPGFARISTGWHYDAARRRVVLEVAQADTRSEPYQFPLTVAVTDAAGTVHRVRVDVPARRATLLELPLDLAAQPRALAIDPDVELLAEFRQK
jgi:aminopeptidase N